MLVTAVRPNFIGDNIGEVQDVDDRFDDFCLSNSLSLNISVEHQYDFPKISPTY